MDNTQIASIISEKFASLSIKTNHPLAPYTTLKIGGPADIFLTVPNHSTLLQLLQFIFSHPQLTTLPLTILGNGSNVLISDSGLRGIVIKNSDNSIEITDTNPINIDFHHTYTQRQENEPDKYLDFTKLDYDESKKPQVLVKITSGTPLPLAINQLISQGITGLQWFAYIPGTVGGAAWYNIHGGSYHFADYLESIDVFDMSTGQPHTFLKTELDWGYETTYFQQHRHLIITSITLRLFRGDAALAAQVRDAWIAQKVKVQPMNSAGSAFANPSLTDSTRVWGEQKSTGWIIDHELNWKGRAVGGAQISLQHANFIVNTGSATAANYYTLITDIQQEVKKRFGIDLLPEVKLLGEF